MSGVLTHRQVVVIARAAALMPQLPDVLSDFERETVLAVARRFHAADGLIVLTGAEWVVLEEAEAALSGAAQRQFKAAA